jgi:hypothetical protein
VRMRSHVPSLLRMRISKVMRETDCFAPLAHVFVKVRSRTLVVEVLGPCGRVTPQYIYTSSRSKLAISQGAASVATALFLSIAGNRSVSMAMEPLIR